LIQVFPVGLIPLFLASNNGTITNAQNLNSPFLSPYLMSKRKLKIKHLFSTGYENDNAW
jgi:hypothetical protein